MGKACLFSSSAIQNLIIIAIFKSMALCNTLMYCTSLRIGLLTNFGLLFPVVVFFVCLAKLYMSCLICDKDL